MWETKSVSCRRSFERKLQHDGNGISQDKHTNQKIPVVALMAAIAAENDMSLDLKVHNSTNKNI